MSGASGTSSPATVTEMPRSNQSVGAPSAGSDVDTWMSGASTASLYVAGSPTTVSSSRGSSSSTGSRLGERHRREPVQPRLGHEPPHPGHDLPQRVEPGDLLDLEQPVDQRTLGGPVAHRVGLLGGHRHEHPTGDRAVAEAPLQVRPVPRLEGDAQREPRRHGIRQVEVAGCRAHPRLAPQPGQVGDGEAGPVGLGHLDDAEVEQPLAGAVERLGERAEHEGLAVAQPEAGGRLPDEAWCAPDVPAGRSRRGCSSAPSSVRTTSTTSSAGSGANATSPPSARSVSSRTPARSAARSSATQPGPRWSRRMASGIRP